MYFARASPRQVRVGAAARLGRGLGSRVRGMGARCEAGGRPVGCLQVARALSAVTYPHAFSTENLRVNESVYKPVH